MKKLINKIRYKLRYGITVEWFNFLYILFFKKQRITPVVKSIDETIETIIARNASVSRFGDGEMLLAVKKPIRFQKPSDILSEKLLEVLQSDNIDHLVCLPDTFSSLFRYKRSSRRFWRTHLYIYGKYWDKYLVKNKVYYNSFMTRPYIDYNSKEKSFEWFETLKKIWNKREIVLIEGEKSRLGYGNDLFDNTTSIKRILCPPANAFDNYNKIFEAAKKLDKSSLLLISLGPTATVLAYDLYKEGFQAIDIGHIDIEYEWFKMGAKNKVSIPSKSVNEAHGGDNLLEDTDSKFKEQVIAKLL